MSIKLRKIISISLFLKFGLFALSCRTFTKGAEPKSVKNIREKKTTQPKKPGSDQKFRLLENSTSGKKMQKVPIGRTTQQYKIEFRPTRHWLLPPENMSCSEPQLAIWNETILKDAFGNDETERRKVFSRDYESFFRPIYPKPEPIIHSEVAYVSMNDLNVASFIEVNFSTRCKTINQSSLFAPSFSLEWKCMLDRSDLPQVADVIHKSDCNLVKQPSKKDRLVAKINNFMDDIKNLKVQVGANLEAQYSRWDFSNCLNSENDDDRKFVLHFTQGLIGNSLYDRDFRIDVIIDGVGLNPLKDLRSENGNYYFAIEYCPKEVKEKISIEIKAVEKDLIFDDVYQSDEKEVEIGHGEQQIYSFTRKTLWGNPKKGRILITSFPKFVSKEPNTKEKVKEDAKEGTKKIVK